jgi:hypothetical protein
VLDFSRRHQRLCLYIHRPDFRVICKDINMGLLLLYNSMCYALLYFVLTISASLCVLLSTVLFALKSSVFWSVFIYYSLWGRGRGSVCIAIRCIAQVLLEI